MDIRERLLAATTVPTEDVAVPELGITVTVRGMTGAERDAFEASCFEGQGRRRAFTFKNLRAKLIAYCCVKPDGTRWFADSDVEALGAIRADVSDRLFGVAQRLSGLRDQDADELGLNTLTAASNTTSSLSPTS